MEPDTSGRWKTRAKGAGRSLLSKTFTQFAACTVVCFLLTAPLFYLLTKHFYAEDMIDIIRAVERGQDIPPLDFEQDIVAGMMLQFLIIFLAICLSLFITMRFATKRLWRPFDDTLQKTERFSLAQGEVPAFRATDIREFERLNHSIEQLMRKDHEVYRIQKEFTENASHELQTPLAIIRSKLDLLMQEELTESQTHLVSDLYGLTMRMGHLNRNLLLLAKIDNAQYDAAEEVDVAAMLSGLRSLCDALKDDGASLHVDDRRSDRHTTVRANSVLLECLLKNLVVNAMRHSADGGEVSAVVEDGCLTVSNTSADGKPLDTENLFRRFRSGDVRQKGNGLGLAIVKAVCDLHHWTVEYRFADGRHCFSVHFQAEHS